MVEKTTIRFQCGVVRVAETDASEGALEAQEGDREWS